MPASTCSARSTFEGYRNPDGSVGTKNVLAISTSVQCVAGTVEFALKRTRAELMPEDYHRYLVNSLRETFSLPGTPIRIQGRGTTNPYAEDARG